MQRTIIVVPYDPNWPQMYAEEARSLEEAFGDLLVEIHHIGSTSVPGLCAKPIIDIMPLVHDIEAVDAVNEGMAALGYLAKGESGIAGRRFFIKPSDTERTHNMHVFQIDNPETVRHVAFPEYLIAHPADAAEYCALKSQLAIQFPEDIIGYMAGKNDWIKTTERKAVAWFERKKSSY